jgi:hypothetical protein
MSETSSPSTSLIKVVIDRETWATGNASASYLLSPDSNDKCCLGFAALACGFKEEDIRGRRTPATLAYSLEEEDHTHPPLTPLQDFYFHATRGGRTEKRHNDACDTLMRINDVPLFSPLPAYSLRTQAEREERVVEYGRKIGFDFSFV